VVLQAVLGVRFLREVAGQTKLVDPFCGLGTTLAVANALGMDAIGYPPPLGR